MTITAGIEHGVELSEHHTVTPPINDCFNTFARARWVIRPVTGYVDIAEVAKYWECTLSDPPGAVVTAVTYCGIQRTEGMADNFEDIEKHWPHLPPECGGPDPVVEHHDEKTKEPCCTPLCGVVPPQVPCCGCIVED